jgi:demethoxyubiquinone hydroxylase (CLK1/Coq7/Cat5 family)
VLNLTIHRSVFAARLTSINLIRVNEIGELQANGIWKGRRQAREDTADAEAHTARSIHTKMVVKS